MPSPSLRNLSVALFLACNVFAAAPIVLAAGEPSPSQGKTLVPGYDDPVEAQPKLPPQTKSQTPSGPPPPGYAAVNKDGGVRGVPEGYFICSVYDGVASSEEGAAPGLLQGTCLVRMPTDVEINAAKQAAASGNPLPRPKNRYGMFGLTDNKLTPRQSALVKCLAENGAATPLHEWNGQINVGQIRKQCDEQLEIEAEQEARAREDASSRPLSQERLDAASAIYSQVMAIDVVNKAYANDHGQYASNIQELVNPNGALAQPQLLPGLLVPVSLAFDNYIVAYLTHDASEVCRALNKTLGLSWKDVPDELPGSVPGETVGCYRLSNGMYRFDYRGR